MAVLTETGISFLVQKSLDLCIISVILYAHDGVFFAN